MFPKPLTLSLCLFGSSALHAEDAINQCFVCHFVAEDVVKIGPSLKGLLGRKIASTSYDYSDTLKELGNRGVVWDEESLRSFLSAPAEFAPASKMNIEALSSDAIDSVVAALQSEGLRDPEHNLMAGFDMSLSDVDYGEYLGSECMSCHQVFDSKGGIPELGNKTTEQFYQLMQAYKQEVLSNQTMNLIANKLSEEEIISIAAYFADQKP